MEPAATLCKRRRSSHPSKRGHSTQNRRLPLPRGSDRLAALQQTTRAPLRRARRRIGGAAAQPRSRAAFWAEACRVEADKKRARVK